MNARRYTLDEIDAMRGDIGSSFPSGVSYNMAERANEIEQRLRTYLMAGIDPAEVAKKRAAQEQAYLAMEKERNRVWDEQEALYRTLKNLNRT